MSAVVVVHGGAWAIPDECAKACVDGVKVAAQEGFSVLTRGGSALDAVEAAVRNLEDNTVFNAGAVDCHQKLFTRKAHLDTHRLNSPCLHRSKSLLSIAYCVHLLVLMPTFT